MTHYIQGNNDGNHHKFSIISNDFLIRNYGAQKTVEQHLSNTERKELSPQNSMSTETSFMDKSKIKTLADEGELREFVTGRSSLQEMLKKVLQAKGKC